jgi:predicted nucleic acid-binding protein
LRGDVSFDTSVLLYTLSDDVMKCGIVRRLLADGGCISVQVLNEFVSVARRKLNMDWDEISRARCIASFLRATAVDFSQHSRASPWSRATIRISHLRRADTCFGD